ncbi:MAG TPA: hypothetical protein EYO33_28035 [Phycisphaerales bacterium]|jgi:hypothetical protein|nr:hypothetical protein [Phycisphaerales bacterium]
MKVRFTLYLVVLLFLAGCHSVPQQGEVTVNSPMVKLDVPVDFGRGPRFSRDFLLQKTYPEPLYLQGFSLKVRQSDGSPYAHHENTPLDWWEVSLVNRERHGVLLDRHQEDSETLLRLTGKETELLFPDGMGMPIYSNEPLLFRGGWSVSPSLAEKAPELQAELTIIYARADQLESPLIPIYCRSAWAGRLDPKEGYEPWMLQSDEAASGRYTRSEEAVMEKSFLGPGLSNFSQQTDNAQNGEVTVTFSAVKETTEKTGLGVNLYLRDTRWRGWPEKPGG